MGFSFEDRFYSDGGRPVTSKAQQSSVSEKNDRSDLMHGLACPDCRGPLSLTEKISCRVCNREWLVIDGIPHFVEKFPYWGEMPLQQMQEVNRLSDAGSWRAALRESPDPVVRKAAEMILNVERANWQWLLDLPPQSRVLDVGAGTGTNSHGLGMHYQEVVALEPVLERVQFMQKRFAQEKLSNVKVVRSSLWTLPFEPESFDLVAMNGVLEWVASGEIGDPRELQQKALKNMFGLLRPGGALYIGIENRICPEYFVGYADPHCGLPYVTVLPRPLAQLFATRKGQNGYRNYLYSSGGYRKLLEEVGFTDVVIYVAEASYNHPRFYVPLKNNIFSYYSRNFDPMRSSRFRGFVRTALLNLGLAKYLTDSYAIVARKREAKL